jgi:hypothetical protein
MNRNLTRGFGSLHCRGNMIAGIDSNGKATQMSREMRRGLTRFALEWPGTDPVQHEEMVQDHHPWPGNGPGTDPIAEGSGTDPIKGNSGTNPAWIYMGRRKQSADTQSPRHPGTLLCNETEVNPHCALKLDE